MRTRQLVCVLDSLGWVIRVGRVLLIIALIIFSHSFSCHNVNLATNIKSYFKSTLLCIRISILLVLTNQLKMYKNDLKEAALEEIEFQRKKAEEEGLTIQHDAGYKNKSPFGQWVDYLDKRDGTVFYYNRVSRASQRDKPKDFIKDKKRIVKETTFGHAFYH